MVFLGSVLLEKKKAILAVCLAKFAFEVFFRVERFSVLGKLSKA